MNISLISSYGRLVEKLLVVFDVKKLISLFLSHVHSAFEEEMVFVIDFSQGTIFTDTLFSLYVVPSTGFNF